VHVVLIDGRAVADHFVPGTNGINRCLH
jgi:hypothetical protein